MNIRQELERKLIHLSSLWMVYAIYFFDKKHALILFGCLFIIFLILEYLRMTNEIISKLTSRFFHKIMRPRENTQKFSFQALTGSFYFILAVFLSVLLFTREIAMVAVLIMVISDTVAALVGKSIGKVKIFDKTLEGSVAFFVTTYVILLVSQFELSQIHIFLIVIVVTLVELTANKINVNDNLSITLCSGFLITLLSKSAIMLTY